jgi:hypothetical protein
MYQTLKVGDLDELELEDTENMSPTEMAAILIQDWNFTDEDGNELKPTSENVGLLNLNDFTAILEDADIGDFLEEEGPQTER